MDDLDKYIAENLDDPAFVEAFERALVKGAEARSSSGIAHHDQTTELLQAYVDECIRETGSPCWICWERIGVIEIRKGK